MSLKELVLQQFIESNKYLPKQGSIEWLNSRLETIGGSEISTIMGLNPYQDIKKLINQKLGITKFIKSAPLWFGNILEYPLQRYTELLFNTDIYETGSIQYHKSDHIKYSPDGIAVIQIDKLKRIIKDLNLVNSTSMFDNTKDENKNELLILFEFKNPYMRALKHNEIPVYYKPQPQLGLEVINICEVSIFIEAVFRFCSYNDIIYKNNRYNTRYHFDRTKHINNPIAYNAFSLYYDINNKSEHLQTILTGIDTYFNDDENIYNNNEHDLSSMNNKKLIDMILENIVDYKDIQIIYHDMYLNNKADYHDKDIYYFNKYNNINKFKQEIKDKELLISNMPNQIYLGHFCYKMFNINIQPVYKSNILDNELLHKVENVINIIKTCKDIHCLDTKKKAITSKIQIFK